MADNKPLPVVMTEGLVITLLVVAVATFWRLTSGEYAPDERKR